jgi:hypothetical protein
MFYIKTHFSKTCILELQTSVQKCQNPYLIITFSTLMIHIFWGKCYAVWQRVSNVLEKITNPNFREAEATKKEGSDSLKHSAIYLRSYTGKYLRLMYINFMGTNVETSNLTLPNLLYFLCSNANRSSCQICVAV